MAQVRRSTGDILTILLSLCLICKFLGGLILHLVIKVSSVLLLFYFL